MTTKRWKVDVYEQGSRRNVMLRDDRCETTMEIDRDGDLLVEFEVDSESYGGGSRTVRAYYPVERVIEFLREAGHPVASRSSSGSGEREALVCATCGGPFEKSDPPVMKPVEDGAWWQVHAHCEAPPPAPHAPPLIAPQGALSSGSPSPATGDET